jgi:hypothetical protein
MAQSKFTLNKCIKLADGFWRYCKAALYSNGKIKLDRCIVVGKEEEHPEGSYYLYSNKSWVPVGADALDAQRRRNAQLGHYELNRLCGTAPAQSPAVASFRRILIFFSSASMFSNSAETLSILFRRAGPAPVAPSLCSLLQRNPHHSSCCQGKSLPKIIFP